MLELPREGAGNRSRALLDRGVAYRDIGLPPQAVQDFTEAIALNPGYARAYIERGATYRQQNQLDAAVADYRRAAEIDPAVAAEVRADLDAMTAQLSTIVASPASRDAFGRSARTRVPRSASTPARA